MNTERVLSMSDEKTGEAPSNAASRPSRTDGVRSVSLHENRVDSRELFTGTREISIAHGDETYRLRLTAQNKLILTK